MKYFLRLTIAPIVYFLSTAFIVLGVQAFPTLSPIVRIILNSIFIGLYVLCTFVVMRKEGELAFNKLLREWIADPKNEKQYDPRKILGPATKGIKAAVTEKMHVFGCVGKN